MKKKIVLLVMVLLLLVSMIAHATEIVLIDNTSIPTDLRQLADEELIRSVVAYGIPDFVLTENYEIRENCICTDGEDAIYVVVYVNRGIEYIGSVSIAPDGTIVESHAGPLDTLIEKKQEETGMRIYAWSLEEQAMFDTLYMASRSREMSYGIPRESDISLDDAITMAKERLDEESPGAIRNADTFTVERSYYSGLDYPGDKGGDEGKWALRFLENDTLRYQFILSAVDGTIYYFHDYSNESH